MQLEGQLRPEAYGRRRGGYLDRRRTPAADAEPTDAGRLTTLTGRPRPPHHPGDGGPRRGRDRAAADSGAPGGPADDREAPEPVNAQGVLVSRPGSFALFDGCRLSNRGDKSPIQSRPGRRAIAAPYRQQLGRLRRLHRLKRAATLKGERPGDGAGVRGSTCGGRGRVDRLIS
jgi:hypothetical protein